MTQQIFSPQRQENPYLLLEGNFSTQKVTQYITWGSHSLTWMNLHTKAGNFNKKCKILLACVGVGVQVFFLPKALQSHGKFSPTKKWLAFHYYAPIQIFESYKINTARK